MPVNPIDETAASGEVSRARRRPLVAPDLVRRWAAQAGLVIADGPLDDATVELYLYWRGRGRGAGRDVDVRRAGSARRAPGATPPVSPALLQAASLTSSPESCPTCGGPGYLACVDLARAIQKQRCHTCGGQWTSALAPTPMPVGDGGAEHPAMTASRSRPTPRRLWLGATHRAARNVR